MSPQLLTLIQGVLASLLVFLGAFLTAKIGANSTKHGQDQQHEINWFEKLSARIDTLEQSNRALQDRIEKVEDKIADVVLDQAKTASMIGGVTSTMKVMWAAFGSGVIYLGAQAFQALAK